jgi:hypothetical protein
MSIVTKRNPRHSLTWIEDEPTPWESFDRCYWTRHCEGFRVEFADGAYGYVEAVENPDDPDHAPKLVVRVGRLGQDVVVVPVSEIEAMVPRPEHIRLSSPAPTNERAHR